MLNHWPVLRTAAVLLTVAMVSVNCRRQKDSGEPDQTTVTVWHWMTDKQEVFEDLARRYQEQTGVQVRFELYAPSDAYNQKVRAASQARRLPDIFGLLAEKHDLASYIHAGFVLELSPYLEADNGQWKRRMYPAVLSHDSFEADNEYGIKPGCYGIPIDLMTVQMVYNQELFRQAGLDPQRPPASWSELIEYGKKLREAGIGGLVSGFGEIWLIDCLATSYAFNIMGEDKVIDTFRGKVPYTDPDWLQVFDLFKQLADHDLLVKGVTNLNNKEAEQIFATGRAAMALNGSWCVNVYDEMNPGLKFGVFVPPPVTQAHPMRVWGSAGASFLVNATSKQADQAVRFLEWLTRAAQQTLYAERTRSIPANRESTAAVSPVLAQFARPIETSTHPSRWPIMETGAVIEAFDKGIQLIIIGEKTPQQIAEHVQSVKDKEMKGRGS